MPFKNYQQKLNYNHEYDKNRVKHFRDNKKGYERFNLNGIKKRLYVCESCFDVGKTEFHEYTNNPKEVIELCSFCHNLIHNNKFDEYKAFGEV